MDKNAKAASTVFIVQAPAFLSHVARSRSWCSSDTAPRIAWRCVRISVAENP